MRARIARAVRRLALGATAALGIPGRLRPERVPSASVLLFHRFFERGEPRRKGLERLRRELEWLRRSHVPISMRQLADSLEHGTLPDRAVLVTADDALRDVLDVAEEFRAHDVPLTVFVCAGWSSSASRGAGEDLVAHAATAIQWYGGPDVEIPLSGGGVLSLAPGNKARNIDRLLTESEALRPDLEELCARIEDVVCAPPECCTWDELRDLARAGVAMGAHSVTHVPLSRTSAVRRRFEVAESKRLCERMLGSCEAFAYPFGMADSHSAASRAELVRAGLSIAFLTGSEFVTGASDRLTLPRITMPDEPMTLAEFRARASGAGIAPQRLRTWLRGDAAPEDAAREDTAPEHIASRDITAAGDDAVEEAPHADRPGTASPPRPTPAKRASRDEAHAR